MHRSDSFSSPARQPSHPDLALLRETIKGPLRFLNPTRARFNWADGRKPDASSSGAQVQWNTRDNRKGGLSIADLLRYPANKFPAGRHVLVIKDSSPLAETTRFSSHPREVLKGIGRMFTVFPYWDVSWLIAVLFTVGCLIFMLCGFFFWLPIAFPSTEFPNEGVVGGVTAFIGGTLFQIGAILLVFEAVNENNTGCFGWALERIVTGEAHEHQHTNVIREDQCQHPHQASKWPLQPAPKDGRNWKWFPSWKELTTHYIYEIGFLASMAMTIGATIFYINAIMSLSWIYDRLSPGVIYGVYLLSYLVGGILFVLSSVLYVLETQPNWYTPALKVLGWHIGVWNLIGSVGWTLAACFGYCSADWCEYQSDLTLIWASAAFTIGSAVLWYEALDKYPVVMEKGKSVDPSRSDSEEGPSGSS
jgi:hypothetical protein